MTEKAVDMSRNLCYLGCNAGTAAIWCGAAYPQWKWLKRNDSEPAEWETGSEQQDTLKEWEIKVILKTTNQLPMTNAVFGYERVADSNAISFACA